MLEITFNTNKEISIKNLDKNKNQLPIIAQKETQLFTFDEIYKAWESCNKNKKNDKAAIEFESNLIQNLNQLLYDINNHKYIIQPADCFIIEEPSMREVFASQYRDRVVHHLLILEIGSLLNSIFINNTYSCRDDLGNLKAVEKVMSHRNILKAKGDVFFLKIDLSGYFMSINRKLLTEMLYQIINLFYNGDHYEYIIYLIDLIINTDITQNCIFKSPKEKWKDLPDRKSLFKSGENGLPIGDLTSQWFSNLYLYFLDTIYRQDKYKNKIFYNRYVDDIIVLSNNSSILREFLNDFKSLSTYLGVKVNNKKTIIRPINYGIHFLGKVIYEDHVLLSKRNINKLYRSLKHLEGKNILSVFNSRVGDIKRFQCYNLINDFAEKAIKEYPFLEFKYPKFYVKEGCEIPKKYLGK